MLSITGACIGCCLPSQIKMAIVSSTFLAAEASASVISPTTMSINKCHQSSTVTYVCVLFLHRKPKNKRSKRFLENRAPKLTENVKNAMIMKGGNANLTVSQALKDIVSDPTILITHQ